MPTYKEQQILDKVCKVTRQKQIKCYDFIPFFDFQYEKIIFNCQPSHFSPCSAVPEQSLLLLTQGNIYNRWRFLNKYLMFLEELNELFRENWSKFPTSGYLVFLKQFPAAGYPDTFKHQRYAYSSDGSHSLSFDLSN